MAWPRVAPQPPDSRLELLAEVAISLLARSLCHQGERAGSQVSQAFSPPPTSSKLLSPHSSLKESLRDPSHTHSAPPAQKPLQRHSAPSRRSSGCSCEAGMGVWGRPRVPPPGPSSALPSPCPTPGLAQRRLSRSQRHPVRLPAARALPLPSSLPCPPSAPAAPRGDCAARASHPHPAPPQGRQIAPPHPQMRNPSPPAALLGGLPSVSKTGRRREWFSGLVLK